MKLKIISGVSCAGKTRYCELNFDSYISFDKTFLYAKNSFDSKKFVAACNKNKVKDVIIMDAFAFHYGLDNLKKIFLSNNIDITDISIIFLYTGTIEEHWELYQGRWKKDWLKDSPVDCLISSVVGLEKFLSYLEETSQIQSLQYVCRNGSEYEMKENNEHFLSVWVKQ